MCCKGIFKRTIPFFLTFAVGLFVASFFVTIAVPSFNSNRNFRKHNKYQELRMETRRHKRTSCWMSKRFAERENRIRTQESVERDFQNNFDVPPPPPLPTRPDSVR